MDKKIAMLALIIVLLVSMLASQPIVANAFEVQETSKKQQTPSIHESQPHLCLDSFASHEINEYKYLQMSSEDYSGINLLETEEISSDGTITPTKGGRLRIECWIPYCLNPLIDYTVAGIVPMHNGLTRRNENGEIISDLAENCTVSKDGLNYTFHIYENVTWHDEVPFNASDVKFTYETIINEPMLHNKIDNYWRQMVYDISTIEILDAYTIIFFLQKVSAPFISYTAEIPIMPKHIFAGINMSEYTGSMYGTGPFKLEDWNPGINMTLSANENYFRGTLPLDALFFRESCNQQVSDLLANNEIDITGSLWSEYIEPETTATLTATPGVSNITRSDDSAFFSVGVNLTNTYLSNPKVRQAISYAIDKTRIIGVYCGYAVSTDIPIPPSCPYSNQTIKKYDFNATKAEELLDEAGFYRNNGTGIRFNIVFKAGNFDPVRVNATEIIKECLEDVGINVTLYYRSYHDLGQDTLAGDFDLIGIWGYQITEPDNLYVIFHSGEAWNCWNYNNTHVDELLEQGRAILNQTIRKSIYDEVQDILATELPHIFLYFRQGVTVYNNDFHGFISGPSISPISPYSLEKVWYKETLSGAGKSPMLVSFIDYEGRRTGYDPVSKTAVTEIPNSTYSGIDSDPQVVKILSPQGEYIVELIGTGYGTYTMELVNIALEYKNLGIQSGTIRKSEVIRYRVTAYENGSISVVYIAPPQPPPPEIITLSDGSKAVIFKGSMVIFPIGRREPEEFARRGNIKIAL